MVSPIQIRNISVRHCKKTFSFYIRFSNLNNKFILKNNKMKIMNYFNYKNCNWKMAKLVSKTMKIKIKTRITF